jgi:hypothetical protein
MPHMSDMGFAYCCISEWFKPLDNEEGVLDKEATNHDDFIGLTLEVVLSVYYA